MPQRWRTPSIPAEHSVSFQLGAASPGGSQAGRSGQRQILPLLELNVTASPSLHPGQDLASFRNPEEQPGLGTFAQCFLLLETPGSEPSGLQPPAPVVPRSLPGGAGWLHQALPVSRPLPGFSRACPGAPEGSGAWLRTPLLQVGRLRPAPVPAALGARQAGGLPGGLQGPGSCSEPRAGQPEVQAYLRAAFWC